MLFLVLARVLLSVSANTVQKRLVFHRASVSQIWILTYILMLGPACVLAAIYPHVHSNTFWTDILLGGLIDALGNLAMVAALRLTDLSVFGPLNAFRPVLALLFGWFFLKETPTPLGGIGVAITVAGAILLLKVGRTVPLSRSARTVPSNPNTQHSTLNPQLLSLLGLRLLGLSLSTFAAVFLKRAAGVASAEMTLAGWILCGLVCLAVAPLLPIRREKVPTGQIRGSFLLPIRWGEGARRADEGFNENPEVTTVTSLSTSDGERAGVRRNISLAPSDGERVGVRGNIPGVRGLFSPHKPNLLIAFHQHRNSYLAHAALFLVMQWITIRIFQETLLAYSFVFFQLGMILQVVVGRVVFREPAFKRRLVGCIIMALGSALILLKG